MPTNAEYIYAEEPVQFPEELIELENFPDGSSIYGVEDSEGESTEHNEGVNFYANLALDLEDNMLTSLASTIIEEIEEDKASRQEWENSNNIALKYTGFKIEEFRNIPFMRACSVFDSTLATAGLQFYAVARAELFPDKGPAKLEIYGSTTEQKEKEGAAVIEYINHYLTKIDEIYYPDSDRLLMYIWLFGSAFRKIYIDPITKKPVGRTIPPQDFIVNLNARSLLESDRLTEIQEYSRKQIKIFERSGFFIPSKLPERADGDFSEDEDSQINETIDNIDGIDTSATENKSLFKFYVTATDRRIKGLDEDIEESMPLPYNIIINIAMNKVVAIYRNWKPEDDSYTRIDEYEHYKYLPGFGLYGLGLGVLLGSNSIALTALERQMLDKGLLSCFPGGLMDASYRMEINDKAIGPSEFRPVETGGRPLREGIMEMPYSEPSPVLLELYKFIAEKNKTLSASAELQVADSTNPQAPVGTTLALLDVNSRLQSSILRSMHCTLGRELRKFFNLFKETLPDDPTKFDVPGRELMVLKSYFNSNIGIIPVSDPSLVTNTHRILRNDALLKLVNSAPQIHNVREAYYRMYVSMSVPDIDKLLPPPPKPLSVDFITENMMMILGQPVTVSYEQDDDAHIIGHSKLIAESAGNPQVVTTATMHTQKHKAQKVLKQMDQKLLQEANEIKQQIMQMHPSMINPIELQALGQKIDESLLKIQQMKSMPIDELILLPEIQNAISKQDAEEIVQQQQQALEQQQNMPQPVDPNQVMMADIAQRKEEAILKHEDAKGRMETEAFKAQLKHESEREKIDADREISHEKNETDLAITEMKLGETHGQGI